LLPYSPLAEATDPKVITAAFRKAHERLVDNPPWLYIVHDLNPRAMSPKVRGLYRHSRGSSI
jgi:ABC-type transport system substrate-binding protein